MSPKKPDPARQARADAKRARRAERNLHNARATPAPPQVSEALKAARLRNALAAEKSRQRHASNAALRQARFLASRGPRDRRLPF